MSATGMSEGARRRVDIGFLPRGREPHARRAQRTCQRLSKGTHASYDPDVNATLPRSDGRRVIANPWLALFAFLLVAQTSHLLEHVAQMVQLHLLGLSGSEASGVVGQLNLEWVHFVWNAGVVLVLAALVVHDRANSWLVPATAIASWHLVEHDVIMRTFLATGIPGSPGLLASGGALAGGLPLSRPDLHFVYNLAETAAIALAYLTRLRIQAAR